MLRKLSSAFGIVLLASSFAIAGQNTQPVAPRAAQPGTTASAQQKPTPTKKHRAKKHRKGHKKETTQTNGNTQPKR